MEAGDAMDIGSSPKEPEILPSDDVEMGEAEAGGKKRRTSPYMTKYERARLLGTRALQIRCVLTFFGHGPDLRVREWVWSRKARLRQQRQTRNER